MSEVLLTNRHFSDFNPLFFGREECRSGHSFGPAIRKYTLIHYVERGRGVLCKDGEEYAVKAGEMFIILPEEITFYKADDDDPWVYRWIAFDGAASEVFANIGPVVAVKDEHFPRVDIQNVQNDDEPLLEYVLASALFMLASRVASVSAGRSSEYVRKVKDYIKSSYMRTIRVEEIADSLNLDRRYLSRIFKNETGRTVQDYIISVRMKEAKRLLDEGYGVCETASFCGYPDYSNFSKLFKRECGVSPVSWKKDSERVDAVKEIG